MLSAAGPVLRSAESAGRPEHRSSEHGVGADAAAEPLWVVVRIRFCRRRCRADVQPVELRQAADDLVAQSFDKEIIIRPTGHVSQWCDGENRTLAIRKHAGSRETERGDRRCDWTRKALRRQPSRRPGSPCACHDHSCRRRAAPQPPVSHRRADHPVQICGNLDCDR